MNERRVLVCVSGMSPAVVTETLYALVMKEQPAFIPHEIHVISTSQGKAKIERELLDPVQGRFFAFMRDYLPEHTIRFDLDTVHVIGTHKVEKGSLLFAALLQDASQRGTVFHALDDITTAEDNEAAANTIYRVIRELKADGKTRLHASVAGGRKSMSFYMGHAFSLLADAHDELSHVLVNEPFENPQLQFYYPPREPQTLSWHDRQGVQHSVSTADADVKLAHLSVLRLGKLLGRDWPAATQASFATAVTFAQAAVEPPALKVVLKRDRNSEKFKGAVRICGMDVDLPPLEFVVFALYALTCFYSMQEELPDGPELALNDLPDELWEAFSEDLYGKRFGGVKAFAPVHAHIHSLLSAAVGTPVADHFRIEAVGKKGKGKRRPYALQVSPQLLDVTDVKGWWVKLRKELT